MFCMSCGLELSEDAKFCRKCAMPLTSCVECGEDIPKRAKYCWKCGKSQTSVGGLKEPESQGSLVSEADHESEGVLPQHSESPMRFMRMGSANKPAEAPKNGALSPFKPAGAAAKRESGASSYNPAGTPSAFRPASAKKENEEPASKNTAPDVPSPFKPLSSAKTETRTTRPSAGTRPAAGAATRPAATRPAAVAAERPAATRPAATRPAATRPAARPAAAAKPENEAPEAEPQTSAPAIPFKPIGTAKRESRASTYNPAGTSSAFRPASEKKEKEAPAPKSTAPDVPSPFKPLSAAKAESRTTRPAAGSRLSSVGSARPAARPEAVSKPSSVGSARPAARPVAAKLEEEAPAAAPQAAVPSSPFKPISAAKTENRAARPAAGSRPSSVGSARPAARPEASPFSNPSASPAAEEKTEDAAPKAAHQAAVSSSPFKPFGAAKPESKASAAFNPAPVSSAFSPAPAASAFNPVPEKKEVDATVLAYKEEKAFTPLKPMSALRKEAEELTAAQAAAAAFKPLASSEAAKAAPTLSAQITSSYSPFKQTAPEKTEPETPAATSPFASSSSSPFASSASSPFASPAASAAPASPFASSAFKPAGTPEPEIETPISTSAFGSIAYKTAEPQDDSILIHKKPVDPTKMFNMTTNTGPMSSFGESSASESLSSLGDSDFGSLSFLEGDSGSLLSDDYESSGEKLPQNSGSTSRFFPSPATKTVTATPKLNQESSPFRKVAAEPEEEKPYVREPGASPFKPLRQ